MRHQGPLGAMQVTLYWALAGSDQDNTIETARQVAAIMRRMTMAPDADQPASDERDAKDRVVDKGVPGRMSGDV